ncbi:PREDICTED: NADH dehydrogenase [ubiquinone] 1 subunit C1, mitochondrial isoform X2 [Gavialis gangeticus]|uniref:NADH dehydrogenase [ubiquinone] 1 subunit C1, mitochondrial isoform X2 n=1 Tax=Gavialis gangeticus TaxID=94835 RepID=UPI00092F5291|nr:PREDICTED: NADH dehydrogenase [ubiquinone] 1 subunit C1, mitochondrial isoform X2 [Gavialis gangeticus]
MLAARAPGALRASAALLARGKELWRGGRVQAPLRQMSSGSTAAGSLRWTSVLYAASGIASIGGLYYAYRVVMSSKERYNERLRFTEETREREMKAWSQTKSNEDSAEVTEAKEAAAAVAAEEVEAALTDGPTEQKEVAMETEGEKELPGADASLAVEAAQQEAAASLEAAPMQETAGGVLDVAAASAHEEKLENMQEEIDFSAQERPDASPANEEPVAEGSGQASEVSTERKASEDVSKDS